MSKIKDSIIDKFIDDTDYGYKITAPKCSDCPNRLWKKVSLERGYCVHCAKKKVDVYNPNRINYPDIGIGEMNEYLGLAR